MSKKSAKVTDDSDLMLDMKTMEALTSKMMSTMMPVFDKMLKSAMDTLKQELKETLTATCLDIVESRCSIIESRPAELSSEVADLRSQISSIETAQLRPSLVIHGLPENVNHAVLGQNRHSDDISSFLSIIKSKMDIELTQKDISRAYRIPTKDKNSPRPLILQFVSGLDRDRILWGRKMLKDLETPRKDLIYVNELLSKQVANLFAQARLLVKKGLLYRTWTSDGIVRALLTNDPSAKSKRINSAKDLPGISSAKDLPGEGLSM